MSLEGTAAILSLFVFVVDGNSFLGPMNLKMMDESVHFIRLGKRTARPQEHTHRNFRI
jgi:hypothetical protein